jgi:hypothetical protein
MGGSSLPFLFFLPCNTRIMYLCVSMVRCLVGGAEIDKRLRLKILYFLVLNLINMVANTVVIESLYSY